MAPSRAEQLVERLRNMQAAAPDIEASAIVSVDGLIMASALQQGVEEDRVSAMSAAMLSLGERISGELGRGGLEQVYIKGDKGSIILTAIGEEAVLTAMSRQEGKLGMIAVGSGRRASGAPDTPTTEEAGVPNSAYNFYVGMAGPSRVPRDIVAKLHAEVAKAVNSPEMKDRFATLSVDAQVLTPEQFDVQLRDEVASNAALVKAAGIKVQ